MFNSLFSNLFHESHRLKKGMGVTNNQHTNIHPPSNTAAAAKKLWSPMSPLRPLCPFHGFRPLVYARDAAMITAEQRPMRPASQGGAVRGSRGRRGPCCGHRPVAGSLSSSKAAAKGSSMPQKKQVLLTKMSLCSMGVKRKWYAAIHTYFLHTYLHMF